MRNSIPFSNLLSIYYKDLKFHMLICLLKYKTPIEFGSSGSKIKATG